MDLFHEGSGRGDEKGYEITHHGVFFSSVTPVPGDVNLIRAAVIC
jgi:hypothetical protein